MRLWQTPNPDWTAFGFLKVKQSVPMLLQCTTIQLGQNHAYWYRAKTVKRILVIATVLSQRRTTVRNLFLNTAMAQLMKPSRFTFG